MPCHSESTRELFVYGLDGSECGHASSEFPGRLQLPKRRQQASHCRRKKPCPKVWCSTLQRSAATWKRSCCTEDRPCLQAPQHAIAQWQWLDDSHPPWHLPGFGPPPSNWDWPTPTSSESKVGGDSQGHWSPALGSPQSRSPRVSSLALFFRDPEVKG